MFSVLYSSMKKEKQEALADFCKLCKKIKSEEQLEKLFSLFLTIEEKGALSARYLIVKSLLEGKLTQREISEKFKVSIAQITRGSNSLKVIDDNLRDFLEKNII